MTLILFGLFFFLMAVGIIFAKKTLKKGCSADPTDPNAACACEDEEKSPIDNSDGLLNNTQFLKKPKK